jgi:hypothetical protein
MIKWLKWNLLRPLQRLLTGYSYDMWWDAFPFMSKKIFPIFEKYRLSDRMGLPNIEHEFKEELEVYLINLSSEEDREAKRSEFLEKKWQEILDNISFSLRYCIDEERLLEECQMVNEAYNPDQKEPFYLVEQENQNYKTLVFNEDFGPTKIDRNLHGKAMDRVQRGLELMGKYWLCFWD